MASDRDGRGLALFSLTLHVFARYENPWFLGKEAVCDGMVPKGHNMCNPPSILVVRPRFHPRLFSLIPGYPCNLQGRANPIFHTTVTLDSIGWW